MKLVTALACVKCGSEDIGVTYHKQGCDNARCSCATCLYGSHAKQHAEHLHYHCRVCQFDWTGPTNDSAPSPLKEPDPSDLS